MTTALKQGRWVKIHEPGQANHRAKENVMDINIGNNRCQAEATYTVRNYKKAAYWLLKYLESAEAAQIALLVAEQIKAAVDENNRKDIDVAVAGENWNCEIEQMAQGIFKVKLVWETNESAARRGGKKKAAVSEGRTQCS